MATFLPLLAYGPLCLLQEICAYFSETYHLLTVLKVMPLFKQWKGPSLDEELISQKTQVCVVCVFSEKHTNEKGWAY